MLGRQMLSEERKEGRKDGKKDEGNGDERLREIDSILQKTLTGNFQILYHSINCVQKCIY